MVYGSQKGRGFNDIFGTLTSTFKPIAEGAANVGASLATGLVTDLLSGKNPKTSIKERGNQAKGMVAQRALQSLQGGRGDVSPSSMGWSDKTAKRKRSCSKSQPPAKRKRKSQTGGIYPPIHYPLGNYPGYDNYPVMMGRGIFSKMRNRMEKDCKDWYERQQKGSGKKRKPKKQTGAGKKRKPKKQKGAGKKRRPKKQKGSGKQTGAGRKRTGKRRKARKQTGDGLWSGIKEIFE